MGSGHPGNSKGNRRHVFWQTALYHRSMEMDLLDDRKARTVNNLKKKMIQFDSGVYIEKRAIYTKKWLQPYHLTGTFAGEGPVSAFSLLHKVQ
jgi:hypothetical protein